MTGQTAEHTADASGAAVVLLRDVGVHRRANDHLILDGIDRTVRTGEHWALPGANGAGGSPCCGCPAP